METWNDFIKEYSKEIPFKSMAQILEAFWHYSKNHWVIAGKLMEMK